MARFGKEIDLGMRRAVYPIDPNLISSLVPTEELMADPIQTRALRALSRAGIMSKAQLASLPPEKLRRIRSMGGKDRSVFNAALAWRELARRELNLDSETY